MRSFSGAIRLEHQQLEFDINKLNLLNVAEEVSKIIQNQYKIFLLLSKMNLFLNLFFLEFVEIV